MIHFEELLYYLIKFPIYEDDSFPSEYGNIYYDKFRNRNHIGNHYLH